MRTTLPPFFWPAGTGVEPAGPPPAGHPVLGHDGTSWFIEMVDGTVETIDPASPLTTRFVNSSAHHFMACLEALAVRRAGLELPNHDEALTAVGDLRHELNRLDIAALGDRDHWWGALLDQVEENLP